MNRDELLKLAESPDDTPFDYVIVGSGAGGGPLAARLALGGCRVLLVEAGGDPATAVTSGPPQPMTAAESGNAASQMRQVYAVPAFHAPATEDSETSWEFSVRHYSSTERQQRDTKYNACKDPSINGGRGQGGIQYPRAAAIGGCTAHHAMIIIRPNDADWDWIAEYTDDASWRSENMQGYFAKIENCLYYSVYSRFAGPLFRAVQWTARLLNPRSQLDPGGHGFNGWQKTSFIDPLVIASIVRGDRTLLSVLADVVFSALAKRQERSMIGRAIARLQILQFLDPNVRSPEIPSRDHLSLISIGTDGKRRYGLRDHLKDVEERFPDRLVILSSAHATRVLFEHGNDAPRAVGVEILIGTHLYRASSKGHDPNGTPASKQVFARREIIVCGGAFNTPQLLMLSGIGDKTHLEGLGIKGPLDRNSHEIAPIVHLPGVGMNLQDRYEVSVISEAKQAFSTLDGARFRPGDPDDPVLKQWLRDESGLYSTNGGAIAMMLSSKANAAIRSEPDLFVFGVPAAFRGYYWGWSTQLLSRTMGATTESRNLWSWVILKAYTSNNYGTVRLRSADPLEPPQIDFHSFDDIPAGAQECSNDLDALHEAVEAIRKINKYVTAFENELQPGPERLSDSDDLRKWIKDEAWGHHACGTCRIGSVPWCADTGKLQDAYAVLDSSFRVHGVHNLRVVDTSVFPRIPGYFIVTPTFMIGEKAADLLLADSNNYPRELEAKEVEAIRVRRARAIPDWHDPEPDSRKLPGDTVGLALSGGGIRSATFCLGFIQALAKCDILRRVDIVSSVSGGGYAASFLGRLFTRLPDIVGDKAGRVEAILSNPASPEIGWLRSNAQYITGGGRRDVLFDIAVLLRNLASVHLWLGTLLFGVFGLIRWGALSEPCLSQLPIPCGAQPPVLFGVTLSVWWWLPGAVLAIGVLPPAIGYWLTLRDTLSKNWRAWLPLVLWLVMLGCAIYGLSLPAIVGWSIAAIGVLLLAWIEQEAVRWGVPSDAAPSRWGRLADVSEARPTVRTTIVRNRLTRLLGVALVGLAVSLLWVVLDTAAQIVSDRAMVPLAWSMIGLVPLLPVLQGVAVSLLKSPRGQGAALKNGLVVHIFLGALAFVLLFVLLFYLDTLVYFVFRLDASVSHWCVVTALLVSAVVGRMLVFLNLSSLQQAYSQKLVRTFLGASNDARVHPAGTDSPVPVNVSELEDDIEFDAYHPERAGGPLHLVGTCVNNTVDPLSGNQLRDDNGMPMCVGPAGISVGRRFHALWGERNDGIPAHVVPVSAVRVDPDPHEFHVLARSDTKPVMVERLHLGQWMAISGASLTTGTGRSTRLAQSMLLGLFNIRIGYWWNSGIAAGRRPGRYPSSLWRRLKSLPSTLFTLQASLLNEWRAYFAGPAARLWYLSDGGHFDNSGLYELIRRRLPIMIAVDATADPDYTFGSLAVLTRQVRLDFCATLTWLDPTEVHALAKRDDSGGNEGGKLEAPAPLPRCLRAHLNPEAIGAFDDLRRDGPRGAALARITYADEPGRTSWLLLVKPCLLAELPVDVRNYAANHCTFPNQSTLDQFFDDDQWEAYRMLGQLAGENVLC
ncbi:GMC oxidoreductase [Crenobacter sp. SG2303]|uniref:GMC oxidoreductase n=1 Tax=Crenobacter oryzisoli TaxID=3056844 RepID=A0ABT7XMN5_9NEIS|nr:GMC oxidoreductase [Crenobacter sp. SG2303]MDN0075066.1 GMC oxidoreductase [Crenobacter sp. SG2303]